MYQSKALNPSRMTIVTPTDASFPRDHILRMATSIAMAAVKSSAEPNFMLELGAITDQPHEAMLQAKPKSARTSLNRSFDSTAEALAVSITNFASLRSRSRRCRLVSFTMKLKCTFSVPKSKLALHLSAQSPLSSWWQNQAFFIIEWQHYAVGFLSPFATGSERGFKARNSIAV